MMGRVEVSEEGWEFDSESKGKSEDEEGGSMETRASLLCDIISMVPHHMVSSRSSTAYK
jgi:hypothetical protein